MVAMTPEVEALIKTLKNPRYATDEDQSVAPIVLDGTSDGKEVQFIASRLDVMEYGRKLWEEARSGKYGPVGPFSPSMDELKSSIKEKCSMTASLVSSVLADMNRIGTLEVAFAILSRNAGKIPTEGLSAIRFKHVADIWNVPVDDFPKFLDDVEDYRFGVVTLVSELKLSVDKAPNKKALNDSIANFERELRKIIETFNFSKPPQNLVVPEHIRIPGL